MRVLWEDLLKENLDQAIYIDSQGTISYAENHDIYFRKIVDMGLKHFVFKAYFTKLIEDYLKGKNCNEETINQVMKKIHDT